MSCWPLAASLTCHKMMVSHPKKIPCRRSIGCQILTASLLSRIYIRNANVNRLSFSLGHNYSTRHTQYQCLSLSLSPTTYLDRVALTIRRFSSKRDACSLLFQQWSNRSAGTFPGQSCIMSTILAAGHVTIRICHRNHHFAPPAVLDSLSLQPFSKCLASHIHRILPRVLAISLFQIMPLWSWYFQKLVVSAPGAGNIGGVFARLLESFPGFFYVAFL